MRNATVFSLLLAVGCASCGTIKPPKARDCAVNTISGRVKVSCYRYDKDFVFDEGPIRLKAKAKPTVQYADTYEEVLELLNGGYFQFPRDRTVLKTWRDSLWTRYQEGEFSCQR